MLGRRVSRADSFVGVTRFEMRALRRVARRAGIRVPVNMDEEVGVPGTMTARPSIIVEDLWIRFMIRYFQREVTLRETLIRGWVPGRRWREQFWALRGINLTAHPGDVVGLIGANGSGKTTLLKTLAGVFGADRGRAIVRGRTACLLSFGIGFNPNLSGHENIYLNASLLGMSKRTIDDRIERIVDFSELGKFIQAPVRTYSAGMRARLVRRRRRFQNSHLASPLCLSVSLTMTARAAECGLIDAYADWSTCRLFLFVALLPVD